MAQKHDARGDKRKKPEVPIRVTYEAVGGDDNAAYDRLLNYLRELGYRLAREKECHEKGQEKS